MSSRYDINIRADGDWFMVEIPELNGVTQARTLEDAPLMAREWIAVTTRAALADVEVRIAD